MSEELKITVNEKFILSLSTNELEDLMNDYYELLHQLKEKKIIKSFDIEHSIYE